MVISIMTSLPKYKMHDQLNVKTLLNDNLQ